MIMDQAELGAQYRDAMASIATHRRKQADAEIALHAARQTGDPAQIATAIQTLEQAVADVEWCQACTVAAGEAYTGKTFDELAAHRRSDVTSRDEALTQLVKDN